MKNNKEQQGAFYTYILKKQTSEFQDMELDETFKWITKYFIQVANEIEYLKQFEFENVDIFEELLSEKTIKRYQGLALSLPLPYESYKLRKKEMQQEQFEALEQGLLVQSWSTLGSLLESTLQMFLSFYYRFYSNSNWNVWQENSLKQIAEAVSELKGILEKVVVDNELNAREALTNRQKNSFLKKVRGILRSKTKLKSVERLTLSELIDLYFNKEIIKSTEYDKADLQKIRDYRNAIHSFQKRYIGTWEELNKYMKYVILLLMDIIYRLPEIPSEAAIPDWYAEKKTQLIMQEQVWFNYRLEIDIK